MIVSVEINPDKEVVTREIYTWLDLFSDVGGLQGFLLWFIIIIVATANFNYLENFMVSKLFKVEKDALSA